jgi:hypothetical protein
MFGAQVLDIAIGMVFVYLTLSLLCSWLTDWKIGCASCGAIARRPRPLRPLKLVATIARFLEPSVNQGAPAG